FAVENPVSILMIVLGILLLGIISYGKLGTDLFPDLNNPKIYVELKAGERPPEEMEKQFVDQVESIAMRQKDAVNVSSVSMVGTAQVVVEYTWNKDMDEAFLDLQKDINSFSQNADIDEFNITQYDPNASPVMIIGLKHERIDNMDELRQTAENYIRNELIRLEGIADVQLSGHEINEVVIETNQYLLDAFDLSTSDIAQQIANYNRNVSGGSIEELGLKYVVKGVSILNTVNDLNSIIVGFKEVSTEGGQAASSGMSNASERAPVFLSDVAKIYKANKEPDNIVTLNGERCIGLSVYKEPRYNTVKAVDDLNETIHNLQRALPGYEFTTVQDQGKYIEGSINEVANTALLGILLAVFVLFIFLRRFGTTLIISLAIPISIVATFNLMYFNHLTLNIMTLGGLALGAGMLVDNAIVVLENIFRNREAGMKLKDAVIIGTAQVGGAITASTITTIVVFLPIVYMHGASGEMFKDQAWTVAFSLLSSLFVAILVIPLMVSRFFKDKSKEGINAEPKSIEMGWYPSVLKRILNNKGLIIIVSVLLIGGTVLILPRVGSEFMPTAESSGFNIELKMPEGTRLERTAATTEKIEFLINELIGDKVRMIYSHSGITTTTGGDNSDLFRDENTAVIKVFMSDEYLHLADQAINLIEKNISGIPDLEVTFSREESALSSTMGSEEAPFIVEVRGEELDIIEDITFNVKSLMEEKANLLNITTSLDEGTPEVDIVIDRYRASYYGVGVESIISQVKSFLEGAEAGEFEEGGEIKDITVKLEEVPLAELQNLVINAGQVTVPLSELAKINIIRSPKEITRHNQVRTSYVYAMVDDEKPFDMIAADVQASLDELTLPANYRTVITGEELKRKESMENLTFALILSIVLVYMVLASQFESLIHPFVIILTIPLAVVGSIWTFFFMGLSLNMMAYIGIIMLVGIAVNDSIILIDRINQLKEEGLARRDAILSAGAQRIRPILMTSITTILALLPLTFGFGESSSLRSPMALAVIGGLITSTILTLIVIPCVYWALDSIKDMFVRKEVESI
ncbi:MAG: efflux RND transporter permease subunit, partial [Bacteroidales bacterium]|nr:efflux RND transporter permease subunit [Bacteroidales bacterium]